MEWTIQWSGYGNFQIEGIASVGSWGGNGPRTLEEQSEESVASAEWEKRKMIRYV